MKRASLQFVVCLSLSLMATGLARADVLWRIPVEHNLVRGESRGVMIVRDDKLIFETRNVGAMDSQVWEYGSIRKVELKSNGYEFHIFFTELRTGKEKKYVMKFVDDNSQNREALAYIRSRIGGRSPASLTAGADEAPPLDLPYRLRVELDLNGPDCVGVLVLREDKLLFEAGAVGCADRAFVREWHTLKSYRRVKPNEFLVVFYKYGPSAPGKVTQLRFRTVDGRIPPEVEEYLRSQAR